MLLNIFDAYNRRDEEFADSVGKVRFCIGGHSHVDNDYFSTDGIPVIVTETDSRGIRSGLSADKGTTTEASINAIIADYNNNKISVIRIGRGESREV